MGRWAILLVACVSVCSSVAAHADGPEPTPAPPAVSWYSTTAPVAAPTAPVRIHHSVLRGGAFVLGGISLVDTTPLGRIDLGVPSPVRRLPRLRVVLVSEMRKDTDADRTLERTLALAPTLQYEWHLPFPLERGDIVAIASAGIRRSERWVKKPDEPYWPSTWESTTAYSLRVTAGVEYRAFSGLIVSVQPSVGFPMNQPDPPDARWMKVTPERELGASVIAGYQFQ